ncbi:MAG: hypothetical protein R2877_00745 [Bdellovibrionota bacterium]
MSDKKDKNLTDDLLEGFDDSFDDELDQALESSQEVDPNRTMAEPKGFVDQGSGEKTEFFQNNVEKTEVVAKENVGEKTQIAMADEGDQPTRIGILYSAEPTRGAANVKVSTEDLVRLSMKGRFHLKANRRSAGAESTRNAKLPDVGAEDLERPVGFWSWIQ